jgi:hypothetical protein
MFSPTSFKSVSFLPVSWAGLGGDTPVPYAIAWWLRRRRRA